MAMGGVSGNRVGRAKIVKLFPHISKEFCFLVGMRFELRASPKAGTIPLEPHLQSIFLW
jgi:hypothetical protein